MLYSEQAAKVRLLRLRSGQHKRMSCFGCGGGNTLSVSCERGELRWHCFRASCPIAGRATEARSVSDLKMTLMKTATDSPRQFVMPPYMVPAVASEAVLAYMKANHVVSAYAAKRAELRYDPRENRAVYLIRHKGVVVDAVGRALTKGHKPKWRRYGASDYPFTCGSGRVAVVVEDAASACAVSEVATGVALMGTSLLSSFVAFLRDYDRCIVALDPDAAAKGLKMVSLLQPYVPTTVALISDDLKYFDTDRVRKELRLAEGDGNENEGIPHNRL